MSLIESRTWDYIIVGTGIGGGVFGLHLAQAGFSVLFVEKGMSSSAPSALKGKFAELFASGHGDRGEILRRSGRHTEPITDVSGRRPKKLIPFLGSGVGGSSAIYGTVLERFQESDFTRWPISAWHFQDLCRICPTRKCRSTSSNVFIIPDLDRQNLVM